MAPKVGHARSVSIVDLSAPNWPRLAATRPFRYQLDLSLPVGRLPTVCDNRRAPSERQGVLTIWSRGSFGNRAIVNFIIFSFTIITSGHIGSHHIIIAAHIQLVVTISQSLSSHISKMRSLPRGIYTPLPCFFKDNEDLGRPWPHVPM